MIELRETEWAKDMYESRTLGTKPRLTLSRIARMLLDEGYNPKDVERNLDTFIQICDSNFGPARRAELAENAVKYALKTPAINIESIGVSQTELDKINSLSGRQIRRLAFTLLCLAKYYIIINPKNNCWVPTSTSEVMNMANVRTSIHRQDVIYHNLMLAGLIEFSQKVDNLSVRVTFVDDNDPVMFIRDFRNLGNRYLMYLGEPYYECENCGLVIRKKNDSSKSHPKYCPSCAIIIKAKQSAESVARYRQREK